MNNLPIEYAAAGILQFGRFQQPDGRFRPLAANFLLMPSYPALMAATASALKPHLLETGAERLLTTRATIPLGAVLAVESGVPLTYPYGEEKSYTAAYTIEGAYDVGHPTTLLADVLDGESDLVGLIHTAGKVGLQVRHLIALIRLGDVSLPGITTEALFTVNQIVAALDGTRYLTPHMQTVLMEWSRQSKSE